MSTVNTTTTMRIKKEISQCSKVENREFKIIPSIDGNIYHWKALLLPPKSSIYHDMELEISIRFPDSYPYTPPRLVFLTPIFHPNINSNGTICISTLSKDWSPALTIEKILLSILIMLDDPNPDDPLQPQAADLFRADMEEYVKQCRETYEEYIGKK